MNSDDVLFETAAREVSDQTFVKGIMARAFSEALGDKDKTLALYIKHRVANLKEDREIILQRKKQEELAAVEKLHKEEEDRKCAEEADRNNTKVRLITICRNCGFSGPMQPSFIPPDDYTPFSSNAPCKCPKCSVRFIWYYVPPEQRI